MHVWNLIIRKIISSYFSLHHLAYNLKNPKHVKFTATLRKYSYFRSKSLFFVFFTLRIQSLQKVTVKFLVNPEQLKSTLNVYFTTALN